MPEVLTVFGAVVTILVVLLAVLARLVYRNARDIASLGQRIARIEGERKDDG